MKTENMRDEDALFSIGHMAKLFNMNIRTLRYYDQIGLLKPEYINEETNYRYYSFDQFERLNTIKYLRALNVPIERIAAFFQDRDVERMQAIFEEQLASVKEKQAELATIEEKIHRRLDQINHAVHDPLNKVSITHFPARRVVTLTERFAPSANLEPLIRDLSRRSKLDNAIFLGKVGVSVSKEDLQAGTFTMLSRVFIMVEKTDHFEGESTTFPAGDYACMRFRGTHSQAHTYYRKLLGAIQKQGLAIRGDSVETTLIDAGMTNNPAQFVTELQIPVK